MIVRDLHRSPLPHLPDAGLHYAARLRTGAERPDPEAEALQAAVIVSSRGNTYAPGTPGDGTDSVIPPLQQTLGTSLGMSVSVVTAELTLAERIPPLAPLAGQAAESLAAAQDMVRELATKLGS